MYKVMAYRERMPRDTLTREQIVAAAVELLDAEGLEGLNMRALGKRLDAAATAVYWHLGSKDDIIAGAADQVWGEIPLPEPDPGGWRAAAAAMAAGVHAMVTRHPWLMQALGSYVLSGPAKARHDDHILGVYEAAGFSGEQADQAAAAVFTYVLGNALGPAAAASLTRKLSRSGDARELMRERTAKARELAARFPRLRSRIDSAMMADGAAPGDSFEFGLQALLDGLEQRLAQPPKSP